LQQRSLLFDRWPRFAADHPWQVVAGALIALLAFGVLFAIAGGRYADSFTLPGTESQRLRDLLEERFPARAGGTATVVVRAPDGLNDPNVQSRVEALVADLGDLPDVVSASSPYEAVGAISADGSIARISVQYAKRSSRLDQASIDALFDLQEERSSPDFQVEAGGRVVWAGEREEPGRSELIGLSAAVIILLIAFGSVVAMGLPIITALLALTAGFFLVGVSASFFRLPSFTPQFGAMIGIGVGIDYSLLVVTRFREGLARGLGVEDAIARAAATAGRSVVFAGFTVVIALLGLWAVGIPFMGYVASAASLIVALAVVVAVVVLPAILKLVGGRIDRWRIPGLGASAHESEAGLGYRLSRVIQRAPLVSFVLSLAVLVVLAWPVLSMRLGSSDAGNNPESLTSRRAYDLLSEGFGPGFNGVILVGIGVENEQAATAVEELPAAIEREVAVAAVSPPAFNDARSAAVVTVIPETAPQSEETEELVNELRAAVPQALEGTGAEAFVGGGTAVFIDVGNKIASRLPFFFAAVIGVSFVLLMAVFRSVLIPLKAALMNALSIGAAFGVLVAVFQWGWFGGVLGVEREGPIESFVPMMLFAILFGLSMDYEVFLVTRIHEEYLRTRDNSEAVARGLSATARVISAAAVIMIAVFLSFAVSDQRVIREFGLGLATAIFLDATLVRLVLVPSIMQLLGDANWWFPPWLDRLVPRIGIDVKWEGAAQPVEEPVPVASE
jgi:RND superfamily putative drug exporter